jgi:hypothetical protein
MNAKSKRARLLSSVVAVALSAGILFSFAAGASADDKADAQPSSSVSPAAGDKTATDKNAAAGSDGQQSSAGSTEAAESGAAASPSSSAEASGSPSPDVSVKSLVPTPATASAQPESVSETDGDAPVTTFASKGVDEPFTGSMVGDPTWRALGDACLTAAKTVNPDPGTGSRAIGGCYYKRDDPNSHTTDTANLSGKSNGYLQLTDNSGGRTGYALYNAPQNSADGLDISFYQYQYYLDHGPGWTPIDPTGGDGIGFFLVDGKSNLLTPGPTGEHVGGAFGYSSINDVVDPNIPPPTNGIPNGVLGLGLDPFGNFAKQPYVGVGCPAHSSDKPFGLWPNTVTLRDGGNGTSGYCILKTQGLDQMPKANIMTGAAVPNLPVAGKNDPGSLVRIMISPTNDDNPYATVTVYINGIQVLQDTLTEAFPSTIKFGFSASTGAAHAVHLIRGFSLKRPSLTLEKSVNHDTTKGGTGSDVFTVGDTVPYNFKVTNNGNVDLHAVAVTDPKITKISCPATTLAAGASMTCTGSYGPLAKAEVAIGHFDNTATASGKTPSPDNADLLSNPATAKVPTYTNGALSVKKMLAGLGASAVDSNKTYTISYFYPAGNYQYCSTDNTPTKTTTPYVPKQYAAKANGTITVKADGNAVSSGPIPTGAVVTLGEQQPADTGSVTWETPKFNPASPVTIGCSDNGTSVTVTNTADQVPGSAIWTKVDDAKTPNRLAGSSWTLTGPGVPANTVVTDCTATDKCGKGAYDDQDPAPGAFRLNGLAWNSGSDSNTKQYTLVEKTAPAGYQRDTTPHTFVISKDTVATGQPVNVGQFVNKQAIPPTLPLTGGMSTDAFLIGGSALIVLSAGVAIALRRRSLARMQS